MWFFVLTFLFVGFHVVHFLTGTPVEEHESNWLTFLCAFLPAVGAALAAINNQGEFTRIAKRSRAMAERLEQIRGEIQTQLSPSANPTSGEAVAFGLRVAQLMVDEVLDWRVVFLDRPLIPPA